MEVVANKKLYWFRVKPIGNANDEISLVKKNSVRPISNANDENWLVINELTRSLRSLLSFLMLLNSWIKIVRAHFPWSNLYFAYGCPTLSMKVLIKCDDERNRFSFLRMIKQLVKKAKRKKLSTTVHFLICSYLSRPTVTLIKIVFFFICQYHVPFLLRYSFHVQGNLWHEFVSTRYNNFIWRWPILYRSYCESADIRSSEPSQKNKQTNKQTNKQQHVSKGHCHDGFSSICDKVSLKPWLIVIAHTLNAPKTSRERYQVKGFRIRKMQFIFKIHCFQLQANMAEPGGGGGG